jgi:hypothetical protein
MTELICGELGSISTIVGKWLFSAYRLSEDTGGSFFV